MKRKQTGAALVMVLIILIIITLVAVSSMRGSVLQQKIATNIQADTMSFSAAQSGADALINEYDDDSTLFPVNEFQTLSYCVQSDGTVITSAACAALSPAPTIDSQGVLSANASSKYLGCTPCGENTRNMGETRGAACHTYKITGEGKTTDVATTTIEQWVYLSGPCFTS
ncbi:MAG: hypothetical protein HWD86_02980 [Kangiellaceae bacterium]|nr:hypothetical protein [Kangiellaceae bacterium]